MSPQNPISKVVIVGGGSAGWLTAGLLASEFRAAPAEAFQVTLLESPDVSTVGVGEGTWPTMRSTLQRIGIPEAEFLIACSASFKQGTRFEGWRKGGPEDRYYHPFTVPAGYTRINLAPHWQAQREQLSFVDAVTTQGYLCDRDLAPKEINSPEYAGVVNYGYHLDAGKFAALLQQHCTERLGVRHVVDHVVAVNGDPDEDIRSVSTRTNGEIDGDLFIDCTGFGALLLGQHYGVPFIDKRHVLFNDTALAVQVPYGSDSDPVASQTISSATGAGWIWDIGLSSRRGIGHVYSSAHSDDQEAERLLRQYIERSSSHAATDLEPRRISFRPGHREKFWHRNCVAVGMSAGFIEPLEASALVLIELAGRMIAEELPANRGVMDIVARSFNETFCYRWDRIIEFLKLHYLLSQRQDTPYWRDHDEVSGIPERLQELLELWAYQPPSHRDFPQREEVFSPASYQYVLYGMGFETAANPRSRSAEAAARASRLFEENQQRSRQHISKLPSNRDILTYIHQTSTTGT